MTNALAQNTDTNNYAIEMLTQASSAISTNKNFQDDSKFSNIVNNLDARFQKAQKNFDKNAKVTNTSSINQKALANNKNDIKSDFRNEALKETQSEVKAEPSKQQNIDTQNKNVTLKEKTKISTSETNKKEINIENNKIETKETVSKEDLSDINNSSPVESSPVFSLDNEVVLDETSKEEINNALEEVEVVLDELIQIIPVVDETSTIENQDLKTKIDELLNNLEDSEESIKTIDEISSMLDDSTMNQDFKNEITKTLDELKEVLNNHENSTVDVSFKDSLSQLKEKVTSLLDDVSSEISEKINTKETPTLTLDKTNVNKKDVEIISEQSKNLDSLKVDKETIKEVTNEIETLIKDVKTALDSKDIEKLSEAIEKLPEIIDEINVLSKDGEEFKIDFDKKIVDSLKNLEQTINKVFEKSDLNVLENVTLDDFKNIEVTDKESMNQLLDVLNALEVEAPKEIKVEIEDLIKKINDKTITTDELSQAIDSISDEIKPQIKTELDTKSEIEIEMPEVENVSNFEQQDNFTNEEFNQNDSFEFDENEVKLKATATKEIDIQNVEENLQKTIATQELLDEMMVEVDIKTIPAQSGALSVVDEVTKLAMGETNTLNSISSSNTITYDSTGVNAVIKNVAQLTKLAQVQTPSETPSMEDLLNQVSNKITQLKDSSTQKLTMVLRPNDLGRLQIELTSNQNGLTTQIMAQNEQVRAYIEKNIDTLRTQLAQNGVNVESIQIKTAGSNDTTTYNGNQNFAGQQEENLNQQNNKQNQNQQQNNDNKDAKEVLAQMSNYDMAFIKDFSSVLNKTLNYSLG